MSNAARYAEMSEGVVKNVSLSSAEIAAERGLVACPDNVGPGWLYDGSAFIPPSPSAEQAANEIRAQRNALLAQSDWTQLADAPVDSLAWANYRQALRDMPQQPGFPWNVLWPVAP